MLSRPLQCVDLFLRGLLQHLEQLLTHKWATLLKEHRPGLLLAVPLSPEACRPHIPQGSPSQTEKEGTLGFPLWTRVMAPQAQHTATAPPTWPLPLFMKVLCVNKPERTEAPMARPVTGTYPKRESEVTRAGERQPCLTAPLSNTSSHGEGPDRHQGVHHFHSQ